jgi:hypothetical protein
MPIRVTRHGEFYSAWRITGPTHNLLRIMFAPAGEQGAVDVEILGVRPGAALRIGPDAVVGAVLARSLRPVPPVARPGP